MEKIFCSCSSKYVKLLHWNGSDWLDKLLLREVVLMLFCHSCELLSGASYWQFWLFYVIQGSGVQPQTKHLFRQLLSYEWSGALLPSSSPSLSPSPSPLSLSGNACQWCCLDIIVTDKKIKQIMQSLGIYIYTSSYFNIMKVQYLYRSIFLINNNYYFSW